MLEYKIKNRISKAELGSIRIGGYYGKMIDVFLDGRVTSEYAQKTVYKEAEEAFENQVDDKTAAGIWQGEFWGKWIISAVRASKYLRNETLRDFIKQGAKKMMTYQRQDGYLGTYKDSSRVFPPTEEEAIAALGFPALWNWNIWCRKYTFWGMLEAYELLGDADMLNCAKGMADHLILELDALGVELGDTGTFNGLASCSIMKPMLILYRITEDEKYLNICKKVADRWENPDIMPGLIANSLSGKRIREWYPDSQLWAKAYEMMSCFDGLLELYRITGESKYLTATEMFFDMLVKHEKNLLSSVAFNDVFGDGAYDVNSMTEPCDVIHFMRLAHELFLLTGDARYMDVFEDSAYNALFASAFKDGLWGARALRTSGRHMVAVVQAEMTHNHCCVNNMPRGLLNFAESCVMSDSGTLYVNMYSDFDGRIKVGENTVSVKIEGDYPIEDKVKITISGNAEALKVKLRNPVWSDATVIEYDGEKHSAGKGFFDIEVNALPCEINLHFDTSVKVTHVVSHPELGDIRWKRGRFISKMDESVESNKYLAVNEEEFIADETNIVKKGVILLCKTKLIGNTEEEIFEKCTLSEDFKCVKCERTKSAEGINAQYSLTFSNGKEELAYTVCDYASGTNIMTEDRKMFSIHF